MMALPCALLSKLRFISSNGLANFKWLLDMVEAYLPFIKLYIMQVPTTNPGLYVEDYNAFSIMLDGVSSDILAKIDEYMHFLYVREKNYVRESIINFFTSLDDDMKKKLNSISRLLLNPQY